MKKQVPESNERSQQIVELQDKLRGHEIFAKFRGQRNYELIEAIDRVLDTAKTPSEFNRKWNELSGELQVLGHLMATLKRDGKAEALEALRSALINPRYTFPGEAIPLEATIPVTLVIFDPQRTLAMVRWILEGHWQNLDEYLSNEEFKPEHQRQYALVDAMFRLFPNLEQASLKRQRCGDYQGWELGYAYQVDVLRKFQRPKGFHPLCIGFGQYNDHLELTPPFPFTKTMRVGLDDQGEWIECLAHFAFWTKGEQKEVLSQFNRDEQKNIATWQFRVHPDSMDDNYRIRFGLHLEAEHANWQHEKHTYASLGTSQEMGAIIDPPEDYESFHQSYLQKDRTFRVILSSILL